ncbi:hypothetical protein SDC9_121721 [bioreactor metagenome]|uniref:DUF5082 domain-containing protein n=1 Tax=bioreactor metagenome TaxID=1076179 RepID=A0A645CCY2_9ZZZZ
MDKETLEKANQLSMKIESLESDMDYYRDMLDSYTKKDIGCVTITVSYAEKGNEYTDDLAIISTENKWVASMIDSIIQSKMDEIRELEKEFAAL